MRDDDPPEHDLAVKVDLHPMYEQVLANLAILQAGAPADDMTTRAIEVLKKMDRDLNSIGCGGMGVFIHFSR